RFREDVAEWFPPGRQEEEVRVAIEPEEPLKLAVHTLAKKAVQTDERREHPAVGRFRSHDVQLRRKSEPGQGRCGLARDAGSLCLPALAAEEQSALLLRPSLDHRLHICGTVVDLEIRAGRQDVHL